MFALLPNTARLSVEPPPPPLEPIPASPDVRGGISDASRQLRALAMLSGSLTDPLTPTDAADVVERQALAVLDATSAVVVTLGEFPPNDAVDSATLLGATPPPPEARDGAGSAAATLTLVHAIGAPAQVAAALQQLRFDAPVPLAEVARTGQPVFLNSESELRRYPEWCDAILSTGACAVAAVPVWANGHLRGVLGLTWITPHTFDEDERAFVLTLGVMCAQAIMRGHLTDAGRQAREAAEHANLAKTQFLQTMSHEFRTPLNAILGYTEILSEEIVGRITPAQKDHLRRIRRSSDHLLALIEELLRFARLDAGEDVVDTERVLAAEVVEETFDIVRAIAERKGLQLRSKLPDYPIALDTDRLKLRQVLVNIVTNAVKYSEAGEVLLVVKVAGSGVATRINFEVTDSGRGIGVDDQSHVFEAFWQVHQSLTRVSGGTGLGLAVARRLARLLGGDVVLAQSHLGHGTTFVVWLPATPGSEHVGA
jgi:signal transduction histidine kinase